MHPSVMSFFSQERDLHELDNPENFILEIGSYNVNGTVRELFPDCPHYAGIDIVPGPTVDLLCNAHDIPLEDASLDVILCAEMLEHDSAPNLTFKEIGRLLKPGGTLVISARGGDFPLHCLPDYHRFTLEDFAVLFEMADIEPNVIEPDWSPADPGVFGSGYKRVAS